MKRWTAGAVLLLVLGLTACGASPVAQAERRWQAANVRDYCLRVQEFHSVWCVYNAEVQVREGRVVRAVVTAQPGPAQSCHLYVQGVVGEPVPIPPEEAGQWTVEGLFATAHTLDDLAGDQDLAITLEFDPELGYPAALSKDHTKMFDDDWAITVALDLDVDACGGEGETG